jgi:parallel beta-helix repeat protein
LIKYEGHIAAERIALVFVLLLTLNSSGAAIDYFISSTGSDSADGKSTLTPWKTISKLNSTFTKLNPGDRILFKRGDIFNGTIKISNSGSGNNPILIGAYGKGNKPVINGFKTLSSWNDEGKGIFSTAFNCESFPNMVTVDGINTPIGRWPNSGWMIIDSHSGNKTITDNELPSQPDWDGAEVVIRVNHWIIDRNPIENHTGTILNYTSSSGNDAKDGYGYFIQNHIKTLDTFGEWYYDGSKLYLFFGSGVNPDDHIVKVSDTDDLVKISKSSFIIFDGLAFIGANSKAINLTGSRFITVQNCDLIFSGGYAIYGADNIGVISDNLTVTNNTISNINKVGIHIENEFINATINKNRLRDIGTIPGMDGSNVDKGIGIICRASGAVIENNILKNIGYIGILFQGAGSNIRYNLIDTFCSVKDDGAGIYTNCQCNQEISRNIVLNGKGAPGGTIGNLSEAHGIYIDDKGTKTIISYNTVANNISAGIYLHNAHDIIIRNNTCFSNKNQILFVHDNISPDDPIRNITMDDNIFFSGKRTQQTLSFESANDDIALFGSSDNNYYIRPEDDEKTFANHVLTSEGRLIYRSLADWQLYTGQDTNSLKLPVYIIDVNNKRPNQGNDNKHGVITIVDSLFNIDPGISRLEYNSSNKNRTVILDRSYIDVKGIKYSKKLTLLPFSSIILMALDFPK